MTYRSRNELLAEIAEHGVSAVRTAVEGVRELANDDEIAHLFEDHVHAAVLTAIGDRVLVGDDAAEAARVACTTDEIGFARWCA